MKSKFQFDKSINILIKERSSERTFSGSEIEEDILFKLNTFIRTINGPFNLKARFKILNSKEHINGAKLGTYGVIKGTSKFIGAAIERGEMDLEELGYEMEVAILYATYLGLGTCWLGGTFRKEQFAKAMEVKENEIFSIISPIGYSKDKKSFMDSAIRFLAKSKKRKEWNEIFFIRDFETPLTKYCTLGNYKNVLENVRLAPSASNKQPWRIVKSGNTYHFFEAKTKGYSDKLGFDIQRIDMGIAICHFDLTCKEIGIQGKFKKIEHGIKSIPENTEYIISWIEQ